MHICLLSYEYPPDTGIGGIGTYVYQLSKAFERKKIGIEVICASSKEEGTFTESEWLVITKIKCENTEQFRKLTPAIAAKRHAVKSFDLIECPEFGAIGLHIKKEVPNVPLIVKLHTPRFLIKEINDFYYDQLPWRKLKKKFGFRYSYKNDLEYKATLQADLITCPSLSLIEIIADRWKVPAEKITHLPNPYYPSRELIEIAPGAQTKIVLYIGRLETRKGVYNLAKAIPAVLEKIPDAKFIFLGKDSRGPYRERSMKTVLQKEIGSAMSSTTFIDHVPFNEIPRFLAKAHSCVSPGIWENYPNVCLEAMSAARIIVTGKYGGMNDMLKNIEGNELVDSHSVSSIAEGIIKSLTNNNLIATTSKNREKVLREYGDAMIEKTLQIYQSVLNK
jgi:glycogen synthase